MRRFAAAFLTLAAATSPAGSQPAAGVDWSSAQSVNLLLTDDAFVPDHLTFRHAVPYRLHLENHGKELHEFTAPEFLAASIVRQPDLLANGGKEIVVQPGTAVDVELEPLNLGSYRMICADHDWDGMVGIITVD